MRVLIIGFGRYGQWLAKVCRGKLGDTIRGVDKEDEESLSELVAWADVVILSLPLYPRGLAADIIERVTSSLKAEAMVVDISAAKCLLHKAIRNTCAQYALFHPMKAPPTDELTLGEAPLVVSEMRINPATESAKWLGRFRDAIGGKEIPVLSVAQQDGYTYVEQGLIHALLLAAAETLLRTNLPLEKAIEAGSPVSKPVWEAVRRHFGGGNTPEVFAGIQVALADDPAISKIMEVPAFSLSNTVDEARKGRAELVTRWRAAQKGLGLAPSEKGF